jgi:hypothetical protein
MQTPKIKTTKQQGLLPGIEARLSPTVQMTVRLRHVALMDMLWWPPKGIAISRNLSMDRNTRIRTDTCGLQVTDESFSLQ